MNEPSMNAASISRRLRQVAELSDLATARRLDAKIDMSPRGVTLRLREVDALRRLCDRLGSAGRAAGKRG